MHLIDVIKRFPHRQSCLDYLAALRWPNGIVCQMCGVAGNENFRKFTTNETMRKRFSKRQQKVVEVRVPSRSLYECKGCGYQFSTTTGTVFHDSHLPLEKWFQAVAMILEAKKGMSALQVCRHLGLIPPKGKKIPNEYKTIWYLCHRIREATKETGLLEGVVEVDETYLHPKRHRKGHPKPKKREPDVVLGMIERGGRLRFIALPDARMASIEPEVLKHVSPDATLQTDMGVVYGIIGRRNFPNQHRMIDHIKSYGIGENHTNTIENAFSLLKRGVYGTFHKVSIKHLPRYCNEFAYRFNRRDSQPEMFEETVRGLLKGRPLRYKRLTA